MLHSGSRNIGYQVAKHYNNIAIKLNEKWFSSVPKNIQLAFLPLDSEEGKLYKGEMEYCIEFALANRYLMMKRVKEIVLNIHKHIKYDDTINIAHNYAAIEHHYNTNVMIHRKGATRAYIDQLGIIPGSQGSPSYIVRGLGNELSFKSCSHGAGRKMGRKQAKKELNFEKEKKFLDDNNIIHSVHSKNNLDESPSAYKNILKVMEDQKDLVNIEVELKPLAVIKG